MNNLASDALIDLNGFYDRRRVEEVVRPENPTDCALVVVGLVHAVRSLPTIHEFLERFETIPLGKNKKGRKLPVLSMVRGGLEVNPKHTGGYLHRFAAYEGPKVIEGSVASFEEWLAWSSEAERTIRAINNLSDEDIYQSVLAKLAKLG